MVSPSQRQAPFPKLSRLQLTPVAVWLKGGCLRTPIGGDPPLAMLLERLDRLWCGTCLPSCYTTNASWRPRPSHAVLGGVAVVQQAAHIQAGNQGRNALSQLHLLLDLQGGGGAGT